MTMLEGAVQAQNGCTCKDCAALEQGLLSIRRKLGVVKGPDVEVVPVSLC